MKGDRILNQFSFNIFGNNFPCLVKFCDFQKFIWDYKLLMSTKSEYLKKN